MKGTDQTLLEQMRITELEIESRKALFSISPADVEALTGVSERIHGAAESLVTRFYELQTDVPEIALVIGDADTLSRLHRAQVCYLNDLFSGLYDIDYVNNRLRIGLVHKRIGVEPKLYLSAIQVLKKLLIAHLREILPEVEERRRVVAALEKIIAFDTSLVFDTYIRSLVSEIDLAREKWAEYARSLEERVKERTERLERLSRTDALTGLLNTRHLSEILTRTLRAAQRRREPVTMVYIDIDDFKAVNDTYGHQHGDEILRVVATEIDAASRSEDRCFRQGGDEFCVVMTNCAESDARTQFAERLLAGIGKHEHPISLSIGFAQTGPDEFVSPAQLLRSADRSMYEHKRAAKQSTVAPAAGATDRARDRDRTMAGRG